MAKKQAEESNPLVDKTNRSHEGFCSTGIVKGKERRRFFQGSYKDEFSLRTTAGNKSYSSKDHTIIDRAAPTRSRKTTAYRCYCQ